MEKRNPDIYDILLSIRGKRNQLLGDYQAAMENIINEIAKNEKGRHGRQEPNLLSALQKCKFNLSSIEAASFFITLAQEAELTPYERDAVLCLWGLLDGYQNLKDVTARRNKFVEASEEYDASLVVGQRYAELSKEQKKNKAYGLSNTEKPACRKISQFFESIPNVVEYIREASRQHLLENPDSKSAVTVNYPTPFYKKKTAAQPSEPEAEAQLSADGLASSEEPPDMPISVDASPDTPAPEQSVVAEDQPEATPSAVEPPPPAEPIPEAKQKVLKREKEHRGSPNGENNAATHSVPIKRYVVKTPPTSARRMTSKQKIICLLAALAIVCAFVIIIKLPYHSGNPEITDVLQDNLSVSRDIHQELTELHGLFEIDPAKSVIAYQTGMELYRLGEYKEAAEKFREALPEQEKLTGADSIETGNVYTMLGISELYSAEPDSNAISDLTSALNIFKAIGDPYYIAWGNYRLAAAYFEQDHNHLNLALEYVQNCADAAMEYCPEPIPFLIYQFEDGSLEIPQELDDVERLYKMARYCEIEQDNGNLLGKIYQKSGDLEKSLYWFNYALEATNQWNVCRYYLSAYFGQKGDIENAEIADYISQIDMSDALDNTINISLYDGDNAKIDIRKKHTVSICRDADAATFLTNRAMSELSLEYYEEAIADCEAALQIWEQLPYSSRDNLSYTYIYLALSNLAQHSSLNEAEEFSPEGQDRILGYLNSAVAFDKERFGEQHPRTAYSLETRGTTYTVFENFDESIDDYVDAYRIYGKLGDDYSAGRIKEYLKLTYEIAHDNPDGFEEWIENLLQ